jgi:hypothetical protein
MTDIVVELSPVIETDGRITFYVDLSSGKELGFIPQSDADYPAAKEAIAVHGHQTSRPMTLAGPVPPTMPLPEARVRDLIAAGKSWGLYTRTKRG